MRASLHRATSKLIFSLMQLRVKDRVHPAATMTMDNGIVQIKFKNKTEDVLDDNLSLRVSDFRIETLGEALSATTDVVRAMMLSSPDCIRENYFSIIIDRDANADLIFDTLQIRQDNVPSIHVRATRELFFKTADVLNRGVVAYPQEKDPHEINVN